MKHTNGPGVVLAISRLGWVLPILLAAGCAELKVIRGPASDAPPPSRVAVLAFSSDSKDLAGQAEDGCAAGLLQAGVGVVERQRVSAVLDEKGMSRDGEQSAEHYKKLGEMVGAEAFIVGSLKEGVRGKVRGFSARLVEARSGEVIRVANFSAGDSMDTFDTGTKVCSALASDVQ